MNHSMEHEELHLLVSGQLSESEALELLNRISASEELRRAYSELTTVDELVREAHSLGAADSECAGDNTPGATKQGARHPADTSQAISRQEEQVDRILRRIQRGETPHGPTAKPGPSGHPRRRPRLPWAVAAVLALACGVLLTVALGRQDGNSSHRFETVSQMTPGRIAHYLSMREQLSDATAIIWRSGSVREEGLLGLSSPDGDDVIIRVTVVRSRGDEVKRWCVDALMQRGHSVELVTQAGQTWPASIRVSVKPGSAQKVPVSIRARLIEYPPVEIGNEAVMVCQGEPVLVGQVTAGEFLFKLFVEAVSARPPADAV